MKLNATEFLDTTGEAGGERRHDVLLRAVDVLDHAGARVRHAVTDSNANRARSAAACRAVHASDAAGPRSDGGKRRADDTSAEQVITSG